jgi:hypothetical protein
VPPNEAALDWSRPQGWRDWVAGETSDGLSPAEAARRLRARFRVLRSFHAARPLDPGPYYRSGITPLTRERWHALVQECFLGRATDAAMAAAIRRASDVQFDLVRDGRVHFCCDERLLAERDGYHLLYGSLSLLVVAIRIDKEFGTDFKAVLRRRGDPVIFVCDVPTVLVDDEALSRLVACLRQAHRSMGESDPHGSPLGFHYSICRALPSAAIVGHFPPNRVIDAVYGHHIGAQRSAGQQPG